MKHAFESQTHALDVLPQLSGFGDDSDGVDSHDDGDLDPEAAPQAFAD